MFSPQAYEEFILPCEMDAAGSYDYVYCHSCGNLTPIYQYIAELPNLRRLHVSPWSDLATAARAADGRVVLEKHRSPTLDLESLNDRELRSHAADIAQHIPPNRAVDLVIPVQIAGGRRYRDALVKQLRESHHCACLPGQ